MWEWKGIDRFRRHLGSQTLRVPRIRGCVDGGTWDRLPVSPGANRGRKLFGSQWVSCSVKPKAKFYPPPPKNTHELKNKNKTDSLLLTSTINWLPQINTFLKAMGSWIVTFLNKCRLFRQRQAHSKMWWSMKMKWIDQNVIVSYFLLTFLHKVLLTFRNTLLG